MMYDGTFQNLIVVLTPKIAKEGVTILLQEKNAPPLTLFF
jgi:hypothetical protein